MSAPPDTAIGRPPVSARWRLTVGPTTLTLPAVIGFLLFFGAPLVALAITSFLTAGLFESLRPFTVASYVDVFTTSINATLARNSLIVGFSVAAITTVLGLTVAYWLRYLAGRWRSVVFAIIVGTMFASFLVRIYAWRTLLGTNGVINEGLQLLGIIDDPLSFLIFSRFAVTITQVNVFLPIAILMFYAGFAPLQPSYLEAAQDLGANAYHRWTRVILPALAAPIVLNLLFTLVLASSDYVTPQFVGGTSGSLLGSQIAAAFRVTGLYPLAAALAMLTLVTFALCYGLATLGLRMAGLDRLRWVG